MVESQYVTHDQHRADLAALSGELNEQIAGLRQEVAVMARTQEHLSQTMTAGFADLQQQTAQLRQDMQQQMIQFQQDMRQQMVQLRQDMRQEMTQLRQEVIEVRSTSQRQVWVILGAVIVALIKIALFP